ncbi:hypothetical protein [Synechococcus sp. EJ6-Ellesmere]|uniref:hypothetical protein n=1 Tax=Synechococcus sp. EJ6-Ellesmere TaxID=2823734 RepID=UPI0020CDD7E8|nr:hypothetical protein [Synechococcus sp. EJ6-Ellesmere]MCP9825690.1 hypothetical protein [Synechococcus sp. EJ6-Ellesmere]
MPTWVARIDTPRRTLQTIALSAVSGPAVVPVLFTGLGRDGLLREVSVNAACWLTLYNSQAAYDADASRPLDADPAASSGVVADLRLPLLGGGVLQMPPGVSYGSADAPAQAGLWARLRIEQGGVVTPELTLRTTVWVD